MPSYDNKLCLPHLCGFRGRERLPLGEDVQQLGDEHAAAARVVGDHVAVAEHSALLQHRRLLQVLVGGDWWRRTRFEGDTPHGEG